MRRVEMNLRSNALILEGIKWALRNPVVWRIRTRGNCQKSLIRPNYIFLYAYWWRKYDNMIKLGDKIYLQLFSNQKKLSLICCLLECSYIWHTKISMKRIAYRYNRREMSRQIDTDKATKTDGFSDTIRITPMTKTVTVHEHTSTMSTR